MVIDSDADNRNIRLGIKQLSEDPGTPSRRPSMWAAPWKGPYLPSRTLEFS
jgi:ribosomal protein S1